MLNEKNEDCILFWRPVAGLQMSVIKRVACDVVTMAKGAATCHWDGWEPVGCFVSFCQSWLFVFPRGHQCQKMTRRPTASTVCSLSPSSVQKPQSHIQWRTSSIEKVATNVCLLYWILTSCFLFLFFCYFNYYCSTFMVELKILLDFSSGNRKPQSWTRTCEMSSQVKNCL